MPRAPIGLVLLVFALGCDDGTGPSDGGAPPVDAGGEGVDAAAADGGPRDDGGPATSGWRDETPVPVRIQEIAVEAHGGRIWVAGGFDGGAAIVSTVRVYDPGTRAWSTAPDLPAPRHHMSLVSHGGDLYALGGMQTAAFEPLDTAWVLRAGADQWTPIASLIEERGAAAAGSVGGLIVMVGGNVEAGRLASRTLIYNPTEDAWSVGQGLTEPREHLAAVVVDDELWALGGRRNSLGSTRVDVEIYDPSADAWRDGPVLPYPRGGFAAAVLAGSIYVIGGEEPTEVLLTVDRLDLATGVWSAAPPTRVPHHGHGAAAAAGRLYVVAGASRPAFGAIDLVESYGPP
ncbi:MAG: hypothetical protein KF729_36490 [Sandaracinaceae bacterium]|nr:hypothetical protein [Sandaracinaceae bacterium]